MNKIIYCHIISSFLPCIGPTHKQQKGEPLTRMMVVRKDILGSQVKTSESGMVFPRTYVLGSTPNLKPNT
uniref:Uncharacterized protein n=1 Tax=Arundo donax TaxID=35708 RepID=A0A0A9HRX3_ARUDO